MIGEIAKITEEWIVNNEEEAKALIEQCKAKENEEGYELTSYKMVKKDKKSKGEIIDSWIVVSLVKKW